MANKNIKTKVITIEERQGAFSAIFNRFRSEKKHESSDISLLKSILSNEKARILHILKTKQPNSLYELAKILGRDFKSVREDIYILERFGLIEMIPIHKGKRQKLKPLIVVDELKINLKI
jgi:predicted transcriptional regulator